MRPEAAVSATLADRLFQTDCCLWTFKIACPAAATHTPRVNAWRVALQQRDSVRKAVRADYPELLSEFLIQRKSALSRRMIGASSATN